MSDEDREAFIKEKLDYVRELAARLAPKTIIILSKKEWADFMENNDKLAKAANDCQTLLRQTLTCEEALSVSLELTAALFAEYTDADSEKLGTTLAEAHKRYREGMLTRKEVEKID